MRSHAVVLLLLGVATISLGGCSVFQGTEAPGEGVDLRAEVNALRRQAAVTEVELARLRHRVQDLESQVRGEGPVERREPTSASPPTIERIASPPSRSESARLEEIQPSRTVPSAPVVPPAIEESELEEEWTVLENSSESESEPVARTTPPAVQPPLGQVEVSSPAVTLAPVSPEARLVYDQAYTLYHEGSYPQAEAKFLEFLTLGPGNELSDNAMFWVGSTRYARGDYPGALRAFRETVESYPDQNKVPDALFKIGQCLEHVGDRQSAETVFEELTRRFPETAAAALAAERLANP
ncbi:MAG: tol-pal system protein YbgF [Thermoanaerobaculia bacterium]|nr:tol-pal system protein YbgF [Thermoanaerobaculia bacterium]